MPFTRMNGVYMVEIGDNVYVGQSINIFKRFKRHLSNCKSNKASVMLQKEYDKNPHMKFYYMELNVCKVDRVVIERTLTIKYKKLGISMNDSIGENKSERLKVEISDNYKGKFKGTKNPNFGNGWTQKQKDEQSQKMKGRYLGNKNPMFGKGELLSKPRTLTNETILKIIYKLDSEKFVPKETFSILAKEFKTSVSTIQRIKRWAKPFHIF